MAGLGYNERGVSMATVTGHVLAHWASTPAAELDFPVTKAHPVPFQRFRSLGLGLGVVVAAYRALDQIGL
jgi:glycine/D-amino acid oxidase-like deaminating enzyme